MHVSRQVNKTLLIKTQGNRIMAVPAQNCACSSSCFTISRGHDVEREIIFVQVPLPENHVSVSIIESNILSFFMAHKTKTCRVACPDQVNLNLLLNRFDITGFIYYDVLLICG